jgi:hypothetical protein
MYIYSIQYVQRPSLGAIQDVLKLAETNLNMAAADGWELDKLMPVETANGTAGAVLVLRRSSEV